MITEEMIDRVRSAMPELPEAKRRRYVDELAIPAAAANLLTSSRDAAEYFEKSLATIDPATLKGHGSIPASTANFTIGDIASLLNDANMTFRQSPIDPAEHGILQVRLADGTISGKIAKELVKAKFEGEHSSIDELIERRGLKQISDAGAIEKLVDEAIAAGAKQVEDYRAGKEKALQSLVGQVMRASKGKANPAQVNEILRRKLSG
jgi:aspartyl-tRNA(Asn)/glutamyl-tRNA(Gln) amidotransferase subunit B